MSGSLPADREVALSGKESTEICSFFRDLGIGLYREGTESGAHALVYNVPYRIRAFRRTEYLGTLTARCEVSGLVIFVARCTVTQKAIELRSTDDAVVFVLRPFAEHLKQYVTRGDAQLSLCAAHQSATRLQGRRQRLRITQRVMPKGDDMMRIEGITPERARTLMRLGCTTYADIAAWRPSDVQRARSALNMHDSTALLHVIEQAEALAEGESTPYAKQYDATKAKLRF